MAEAIEKTQKTQWHPGFVGGLKISLQEYSDQLEYKPDQVTGLIHIPAQVVVTKELVGDAFASLRVLSKNPEEADIRAFVERAVKLRKPGDRQDADAVLQVSVSANKKIYDGIKGRDTAMCEALRELMKPEWDAMVAEIEARKAEMEAEMEAKMEAKEAEFDKRVRSMQEESDKREEVSTLKKINSIMEKLKYTAEQAMELLDIPIKEQSKYLRML